jgi:hypothetical protein
LPASSIPPHIEAHRYGQALSGLDAVNAYIRGQVDSKLVDALNELDAKERERHESRWERIERAIGRIEFNQNLLLDHFRSLTVRVNELEGQHARNHPCGLASVPPSSRGEDVETERAIVEAQEA